MAHRALAVTSLVTPLATPATLDVAQRHSKRLVVDLEVVCVRAFPWRMFQDGKSFRIAIGARLLWVFTMLCLLRCLLLLLLLLLLLEVLLATFFCFAQPWGRLIHETRRDRTSRATAASSQQAACMPPCLLLLILSLELRSLLLLSLLLLLSHEKLSHILRISRMERFLSEKVEAHPQLTRSTGELRQRQDHRPRASVAWICESMTPTVFSSSHMHDWVCMHMPGNIG